MGKLVRLSAHFCAGCVYVVVRLFVVRVVDCYHTLILWLILWFGGFRFGGFVLFCFVGLGLGVGLGLELCSATLFGLDLVREGRDV